ncbi:MAG: uroporphyrinogen-III synthase, partial [Pseudomonadota bacterium]|nr:uroporphyrinogen-III synthase [Pseudomonadota bacterium]
MSAPLMAPYYHAPEMLASGKFSGVILTSRHAVTGLCAATGGKLDDRIAGLPAFAVGRATGRAACEAGFRNVTIGNGGGAGLVPLITGAAPRLDGPLLWPAAVHRGFDMAAPLDGIADVVTWPVYEMRETEILPDDTVAEIAGGNVLGVILMSVRSARLFRERL